MDTFLILAHAYSNHPKHSQCVDGNKAVNGLLGRLGTRAIHLMWCRHEQPEDGLSGLDWDRQTLMSESFDATPSNR